MQAIKANGPKRVKPWQVLDLLREVNPALAVKGASARSNELFFSALSYINGLVWRMLGQSFFMAMLLRNECELV